MGWTIQYDFIPRKQFFAELTGLQEHTSGDRSECLKRLYRGAPYKGVLYTLWRRLTPAGQEKYRYVMVFLIALCRPSGWGYKDMSHDMCPYNFSCPLSWLEGLYADDPDSRKWIDCVKEYWAARREKRPSRISDIINTDYKEEATHA